MSNENILLLLASPEIEPDLNQKLLTEAISSHDDRRFA